MSDNAIFYFEVHQPRRLRPYRMPEIGNEHDYFWDSKNMEIFKRISENSYIPATKILLENEIKATFSFSGTMIEQANEYCPEVIDVFREYFKSGLGEILDETYYHSLAFLLDKDEFINQINEHKNMVKRTFGIVPKNFRNTELIYSNYIGDIVSSLGYGTILAEGTDKLGKSPNFLYKAESGINLLLRNYRLSDDISFRFSNQSWNEFPLAADKYANWIKQTPGDFINIFMDYETFGEHQSKETGIFEFLKYLPVEFSKNNINFLNVNEANNFEGHGKISVKDPISWADTNRDLSPWLGNPMQREAFGKIRSMKDNKNKKLWRYLQASDHLYYMSTGDQSDQEVHEYFNPYKSPYNAFLYFMNIINDFESTQW